MRLVESILDLLFWPVCFTAVLFLCIGHNSKLRCWTWRFQPVDILISNQRQILAFPGQHSFWNYFQTENREFLCFINRKFDRNQPTAKTMRHTLWGRIAFCLEWYFSWFPFMSSSLPQVNLFFWALGFWVWDPYELIYTLGVAPSQSQWQIKLYRDPPTKNGIILVVTVTGKGPYPRYTTSSNDPSSRWCLSGIPWFCAPGNQLNNPSVPMSGIKPSVPFSWSWRAVSLVHNARRGICMWISVTGELRYCWWKKSDR